MKYCLDCSSHHPVGYRCPKVERRRYRASRQRRIRSTAAWQKARALARERDGQRCARCPSTTNLSVHHIVSLEDGGEAFALNNLITLCRSCHSAQHGGGMGSTRKETPSHPRPVSRETNSATRKNLSEPDNDELLVG
jgi:5-methylcytosine-specific restriction endonuclease McrA